MFDFFKIRKNNIYEKRRRYYSTQKRSCNTCKYCLLQDIMMGYSCYICKYRHPDFNQCEDELTFFVCDQYKPKRTYKKYLKGKYNS